VSACHPNQLLAISLTHPVFDAARWESVVNSACDKLLNPVGLRSLSPDHPDFKPTYYGDLSNRDAAYHQGTAWAWLIGPFLDAWLKVHPEDRAGARRFLDGFIPHLGEGCIGSISEVFDAIAPFTPRGCIAQAWSVAEVLRCRVMTSEPEDSRERSGRPLMAS
jgi:glycogen debranching enzyme